MSKKNNMSLSLNKRLYRQCRSFVRCFTSWLVAFQAPALYFRKTTNQTPALPVEPNKIPRDAQLIWSSRRGMLELDLLLAQFITQKLATLTDSERCAYARLLTHPDPDLFNWLMGYELTTDPECVEIVACIQRCDSI